MALLAAERVDEWLYRQGYFTIRGVKVGVGEMDLLAFKPANEPVLGTFERCAGSR